ncbi:hypothetical protein ACIBHX_22855 [Nonomuraea sp. NPDC050536]|uniref:divisome protein SepX/GlpR n=1 Tax=Nonomuraea sp. NPDC050536 TaxID=3364366 RepID=UPI0037CCAEF1
MWLRRDKTNLAELAELEEEYYTGEHQIPDLTQLEESASESASVELGETGEIEVVPEPPIDPRQFRARRRAIIVARRRRLLFFTALLVIASVVTAAVKMIPWWGVAPSGVFMVTYMAFLRIAVNVDRERRERAAKLRADRARRLRDQRRAAELAAEQAEAEIIEFAAHHSDVLFDQYAEPPRRAVGD